MENRKKQNRSSSASPDQKGKKKRASGRPAGTHPPVTGPKDPVGGPARESAAIHDAGSWEGCERGARGYKDDGGSQLTRRDEQPHDVVDEGGTLAVEQSGNVEISAAEWMEFFNSFSRQHDGWLATITVMKDGREQTVIREQRLEGINCDHLLACNEIYLSIDRGEGGHLTRPVRSLSRMVFRRDLQGAHEGVDIT